MDKATEHKRWLSFARVCIPMDFNSSFTDKFDIDLGNDQVFEVTVNYSFFFLVRKLLTTVFFFFGKINC